MNRLFIIGNGFDLDLNYATSYKDFLENNNEPENGKFPFEKKGKGYSTLGKFLRRCKKIRNWSDLERDLGEYGKANPEREYQAMLDNLFLLVNKGSDVIEGGTSRAIHEWFNKKKRVEGDHYDFELLKNRLKLYLKSVDYSKPKIGSAAERILRAISNGSVPTSIYSFNYTNLEKIGVSLGVKTVSPTYVHGSIDNDDIILGVGDNSILRRMANYMYKTSDPKYVPTNIMNDLDSADEIYIFGLSLYRSDYPYFENFFQKIADGAYEKKKYIRIFTYDDDSRSNVIFNIRRMTPALMKILDNSDIDFIRTKDNIDNAKVQAILKHLA